MQDQEITRIYKNIIGLLLQGQFPGSYAPAISESVQFLETLIGQINEPKEEKAADGSDNVPDASGLGDSVAGDSGRQGDKAD